MLKSLVIFIKLINCSILSDGMHFLNVMRNDNRFLYFFIIAATINILFLICLGIGLRMAKLRLTVTDDNIELFFINEKEYNKIISKNIDYLSNLLEKSRNNSGLWHKIKILMDSHGLFSSTFNSNMPDNLENLLKMFEKELSSKEEMKLLPYSLRNYFLVYNVSTLLEIELK